MSDTLDLEKQGSSLDEYSQSDLAFTRDTPLGTLAEPSYSGALSFMRRQFSKDLKGADVAVFGIPYDLSVSNRPGARFGPRAIRQASSIMAWDRVWGWPFDPFDKLKVVDFGDLAFDPGYPSDIPHALSAQTFGMLSKAKTTLMLGGDHFSSYPVLKAHAQKHGPLSLVQFDAHSDTWADDGDGRIDHGTMFYKAIKDGIINPDTSIQVGIRTNNDEPQGVKTLSARWLRKNGADAASEEIRRRVGDTPVYISFDIDCLDPAYAPGTGTPVVGGPTTGEVRDILRGLEGINLKGMDVVEVSPSYDHAEITALAGATIALDLLCIYATRK
ncbi:agmatinase [Rhodobacteraceae bacterium RKSG542]|uniref:agmatinase n=1 Tax=Pseudovibrio flavus TaxID=2529854 RepID=UPI0012BD1120|nr:agmatinase [Pseudovibrio flavus]MTI18065.1 agmatinase [Pseudovibrio flavus]